MILYRNNLIFSLSKNKCKVITLYIITLITVSVSFWLYGNRPIAIFPDSAVDDGLYIHQADNIVKWLHGDSKYWLGEYNYLTLSKSPLYGCFLAFTNISNIPIRILEYLLFILNIPLLLIAILPLTKFSIRNILIFTICITFLPFLASYTHLLRNSLSIIYTDYYIISLIGIIVYFFKTDKLNYYWISLSGFSFSLVYLNREEGFWILFLLPVVFYFLINKLKLYYKIKILLISIFIFTLSALPLICIISLQNFKSYGVFLTTLRRSNELILLQHKLSSLDSFNKKKYIPINRNTRYKLYSVSSNFLKLKPFLEGENYISGYDPQIKGFWFAGNKVHSVFNGYDSNEKEIFASNLEFSLLYSSSAAGFDTPKKQLKLFRSIIQDIDNSVALGVFQKNIGLTIGNLDVIHFSDYTLLVKSIFLSLYYQFNILNANIHYDNPSLGKYGELKYYENFVHSKILYNLNESSYNIKYVLNNIIIFFINTIYVSMFIYSFLFICKNINSVILNNIIYMKICILLLLSIALFTVIMGLLNTSGMPFMLNHNADPSNYNVLGYSSISILSGVLLSIIYNSK